MPVNNKNLAWQPRDDGANYNAFGFDPDGRIAYLVALFYGPDWLPQAMPKQFGGPPAPPHFGPSAHYQMGCLPPGFKPRLNHDYIKMEAVFAVIKQADTGGEYLDYLEEPEDFDPDVFDAFKFSKKFLECKLVYQMSKSGLTMILAKLMMRIHQCPRVTMAQMALLIQITLKILNLTYLNSAKDS
jgi:hypothetical protein